MKVGIIQVEHPRSVLFGLLGTDLAFGAFEPLFAELLQPGVPLFHQHGAHKFIRIDNAVRIVVEPDAHDRDELPGLSRSAGGYAPCFPQIECGVVVRYVAAYELPVGIVTAFEIRECYGA